MTKNIATFKEECAARNDGAIVAYRCVHSQPPFDDIPMRFSPNGSPTAKFAAAGDVAGCKLFGGSPEPLWTPIGPASPEGFVGNQEWGSVEEDPSVPH